MKLSGETEWLVAGKEDEALNIESPGPRRQTDVGLPPDEPKKELISLTPLFERLKIKEVKNEILLLFSQNTHVNEGVLNCIKYSVKIMEVPC